MIDNKKGDIDWFIVTIIISVLTLVVFVLIGIFFPFGDTVDRAACKVSVVLRATLPGDTINIKDQISLRCKTRNICITTKSYGKGNCTGIGKDFETMRLTGTNDVLRKEQIKMFFAREMADCWGMFGEGKLQIFSKKWTSEMTTSKGIICSKMAFDSNLLLGDDKKDNTPDDLKNVSGLTEYMITHKVPNQNFSYMDYLRNTPEGQSANELYGNSINTQDSLKYAEEEVLDLTKVKSIVYIETTKSNAGRIFSLSAAAVGVAVIGVLAPVAASGATKGVMAVSRSSVGKGLLLAGGAYAVSGIMSGGDWLQDLFLPEYFKDVNSVGGLILTDYSAQGFSDYKIDSFENL